MRVDFLRTFVAMNSGWSKLYLRVCVIFDVGPCGTSPLLSLVVCGDVAQKLAALRQIMNHQFNRSALRCQVGSVGGGGSQQSPGKHLMTVPAEAASLASLRSARSAAGPLGCAFRNPRRLLRNHCPYSSVLWGYRCPKTFTRVRLACCTLCAGMAAN